MTSPQALSVVVPCYNEEGNLEELYHRISAVCREMCGDDWELILVDDGSRDDTWKGIKALSSGDFRVVGVKLSRNFGHQTALSAGLELARGARILVLDADLQDPPELLPEMMRLMDQGADVVYGRRRARYGEGPFKKTTAGLFYRLFNRLSDVPIPANVGDFRLMNRTVANHLVAMPERHRFLRGMTSWVGFNQASLGYERQGRKTGTSKYPLRSMVSLAIDALTSFSIRPLRMASLLGMSFGALAVLGILYAMVSWITGNVVQGWTSVIIVVLILGSVQLFVLGIMGEYLGRLYIESKQRPLYLVQEVVGREESRPATAVKRRPAENDAG